MSSSGFLQGTVVLDNTGNSVDNGGTFDPSVGKTPQPGATVALYQGTTATGTPYATTTTDANGNYSFTSLPTGQYTLVETPPSGYANDGTEVNSPLNPASGGTNSITVTVEDLSNLSVTYDAPHFYDNLLPGFLDFTASPDNGKTYDRCRSPVLCILDQGYSIARHETQGTEVLPELSAPAGEVGRPRGAVEGARGHCRSSPGATRCGEEGFLDLVQATIF